MISAGGAEDEMRVRARSLEPLTGLAMWSSTEEQVELIKGNKGLGFSILDYQVTSHTYDVVVGNCKKLNVVSAFRKMETSLLIIPGAILH